MSRTSSPPTWRRRWTSRFRRSSRGCIARGSTCGSVSRRPPPCPAGAGASRGPPREARRDQLPEAHSGVPHRVRGRLDARGGPSGARATLPLLPALRRVPQVLSCDGTHAEDAQTARHPEESGGGGHPVRASALRQEVKGDRWLFGLAAAGLIWLGIFSLFFSVGAALGVWPAVPEGRVAQLDLGVGLGFGVCLLLSLLRRS